MELLPTATSADERERGAQIAVLPVGSFEQHGDHLPLTTDTIVACAIAKAIATQYSLFLLPPITVSCSHEHAAFAGTVSIRASTLYAVMEDIAKSLAMSGVPKIMIVNGHGGNYILSNFVQEFNEREVRAALYPGANQWRQARISAGMVTDQHQDMHAGELETSVLLAVAENLVKKDRPMKDHFADDRTMLLTLGMTAYTTTGVVGQPSAGDSRKGLALIESLSEQAARSIATLGTQPGSDTPR